MAPSTILFLSPTDPTSSSKARSHAMIQWRRRKAAEQAEPPNAPLKLQNRCSSQATHGYHARGARSRIPDSRSGARDRTTRAEKRTCTCGDKIARTHGCLDCRNQSGGSDSLTPGPVTLLGAGRVDPFQSFAVRMEGKRAFELLDFCAYHIYPGFMDVDQQGKSAPLTCAWIPAAMRSPAYFHACLFGISSFLERRLGIKDLHSSFVQEQLGHKIEAMRHIQNALAMSEPGLTDETILAVYQLACHGNEDTGRPQSIPTFYPLLQSLQWLDLYGEIEFVEEHWAAFTKMIDQRGGLETITLTGVKDMIRLADVLRASKMLCKPSFSNVNLQDALVRAPPSSSQSSHSTSFPELFSLLKESGAGHGYQILTQCGLLSDSEAIQVFVDLASLSSTLEAWSEGTLRHPYMIDIANIRLSTQHRLLNLPVADSSGEPGTDDPIYETCRLTAILYAVSVTYPLPSYGGPQAELVRKIKVALLLAGDDMPRELRLWCLIIGGISAAGQPERVWYATQTGETCAASGIKSWEQLEEVLRRFAWLGRTCDPGGRVFLSFL